MASDKRKDINGYDNRGYDVDQTEIGMKPMSTSPENWRMSKHFVEPSTDSETSSSLRRKNRTRFKILVLLMLLLLAAIIAMGVLLYIFSNDTSSDVFEDLRTTSASKMTTPREVNIVDLGVNITLVDREYTEDLGDSSSSAYMTLTTGIISSIDSKYESDLYYSGATVISVSPGSIKVELMVTFNMPMEETERSNAIESTHENLIQNIVNALDENTIVEIITPLCDIEPCANEGTCNDIPNSSDYSCTCEDGYDGKSCQNDIDECVNNPCENGGECTNQEGSYTCTCAAGFAGINCEQDIDECMNNPCENGGECTNQEGSYTCTCAAGFTGSNCEQDIDECMNNPCENGGECTNQEGSYTCTCAAGFIGSNCQQECGYRPAYSPSSSRIIGGSPAQLGEWPWMVSLRDRSNVHRCAAVVISNTTAVTAAHCV